MNRKIIITNDGSHSIRNDDMDESYHSKHGALQESRHVFIEAGLRPALNRLTSPIHIMEMGFGTGLNALLTLIEIRNVSTLVQYTGIELHPVSIEDAGSLNYVSLLAEPELQPVFMKMHTAAWNEPIWLSSNFHLNKQDCSLQKFRTSEKIDLVYFDAFSPTSQPELWTVDVFKHIYSMMNEEGELVTYCSKGDVRRALLATGFNVVKMPGPKGKREMLKAIK